VGAEKLPGNTLISVNTGGEGVLLGTPVLHNLARSWDSVPKKMNDHVVMKGRLYEVLEERKANQRAVSMDRYGALFFPKSETRTWLKLRAIPIFGETETTIGWIDVTWNYQGASPIEVRIKGSLPAPQPLQGEPTT
jgi:hypothetical protein